MEKRVHRTYSSTVRPYSTAVLVDLLLSTGVPGHLHAAPAGAICPQPLTFPDERIFFGLSFFGLLDREDDELRDRRRRRSRLLLRFRRPRLPDRLRDRPPLPASFASSAAPSGSFFGASPSTAGALFPAPSVSATFLSTTSTSAFFLSLRRPRDRLRDFFLRDRSRLRLRLPRRLDLCELRRSRLRLRPIFQPDDLSRDSEPRPGRAAGRNPGSGTTGAGAI